MLTATLEDARRNRALRAVTASGPDALVDAVVSMLALELDAGETAFLHASASGVAEASTLTAQALGYTAYSEGRSALERYDQSQRLERAIGLFNRALEQDPRYALAHAGPRRGVLAALPERAQARAAWRSPSSTASAPSRSTTCSRRPGSRSG